MLCLKYLLNPRSDLGIFRIIRNCSDLSIVKTQLEVPTFCDIHVDLACKVRIKPLNVHKYHNSNVFLLQTDMKYDNGIEHYIDGNKVIVKSQKDLNPNTLCSIKAPVKANLHIQAHNDVSVGFFQGDKLKIKTEGNVFVDRFQGDTLDVVTNNGNVVLNNFIHASKIFASTNQGSITAGKLQGLELKLKVAGKGGMTVQSSYCNESIFVVEQGDMELNNAHKDCKIFLVKGNLILNGFDGKLSAVLNAGSADMHIAKLTDSSDVMVKNGGNLFLKLTDSCLDDTALKIHCSNIDVAEALKNGDCRGDDKTMLLNPSGDNLLLVHCPNGTVKVENTSWQEMIRMKVKNK